MNAVRWGIIGCGNVTEVKSGPAFQRAERSELVAVMRRNGALAADFARRHGVPKWYGDADRLIDDPDVDAVYVATPPGSHCEYALRACRHGKPVYVEKPMARNHDECARMIEAFDAAGVPLFVAYYRRALPRFLRIKSILETGVIGTISEVRYRYAEPQRITDVTALPWRVNAEDSGGGLFFDLGSHALDLVDFLLGPLEDVEGAARNGGSPYDVEDAVSLAFRIGERITGTATWDFAAGDTCDEMEIRGTHGHVRFAVFGNAPVRCEASGLGEDIELPNPRHIEQPMVQSVVNTLGGHGACASTGTTAARTAAVMDRATAGYYGSRAGEFWRHPERWPGRPRRPSV